MRDDACNIEFVKKKHCRDLQNDGPKYNTDRAAVDFTRVGLANYYLYHLALTIHVGACAANSEVRVFMWTIIILAVCVL